jgi:nitrous oxide reductase accessory protein NosL
MPACPAGGRFLQQAQQVRYDRKFRFMQKLTQSPSCAKASAGKLLARRSLKVGGTLTLLLAMTLYGQFMPACWNAALWRASMNCPLLAHAGDRKPIKPAPKDKCPVCGMFVARYPDWVAQIIFKDGSYAVFDGAKDMFKYYLNLNKYNRSKKPQDIDSIYVTDYYSLTMIDGLKAYYVAGSNIYGPMGHELIPFEKEEDAKEFMADHAGKSLFKFKDVNDRILKDLD